MTPAIIQLNKSKTPYQLHEYAHDPACTAYGEEAAQALGVPAMRIFKTLVVELASGELVVALVSVDSSLQLKAVAKAAGAKKAKMAAAEKVERSSGYVLGGVSPLGQKKRLRTFIDTSAEHLNSVFISAGKRGLEIEIAPAQLARLLDVRYCELAINPTK
ncbi:Cys-tRNA(Pro) deacylase [Gilvimarinus xylanilyticus]|uniref:Cys-tRNA(Pro)/Cys-tRNA(Cys) deacylase n=1 Tax=Gilvimarinus xylanilyticus TaxID=2944139 RepID=A0A9X2I391_9GAMM|nr:Cys-tRNA(Pro) deacylase [Gilvimarinus xylanilyticus]MCP8899525.1 Cys-tRNA(Pro) deacylase [Gilvimarinus xylanilyticus]